MAHKEGIPQEPFRKIVNNRRGNLSQETSLNQPIADAYMVTTDMRRTIRIEDSDKRPESNTVRASTDTLAMRSLAPLQSLREVRLNLLPFYTVTRTPEDFTIQVHERIIDDSVRKKGYIDRRDYNEQFTAKLNEAIKRGLIDSLAYEKLGLTDQGLNYFAQFITVSGLELITKGNIFSNPLIGTIGLIGIAVTPIGTNLATKLAYDLMARQINTRNDTPSIPFIKKDWRDALSPLAVPVDKYIRGRWHLAQHGNKVIIPNK